MGISQSGNQPLFPAYKCTTPPVFSCFRCTPWGVRLGTPSCHTPRARACGRSQSLKKLMFRDAIVARAGLGPASDGPCERQAACVQRWSLRRGVVAQERWARNTGARTLCTLRNRGTVSQPPETLQEQARGSRSARGKGGGRGERVLQQHSRASTWPGHSRTRASGTRSLSPCLE